MSLVKWAFIGLLVLPAAEMATLLLAAAAIGWLATTVLFVATSALGVWLLQKSGRADVERLRATFVRDGLSALHLETPGLAPLLGAILLLFPGFITDAAGLALLVPRLRRWLGGALARRAARARARASRKRPGPAVIELEPSEWRQVADPAREPSGRKPRRASKPKRLP